MNDQRIIETALWSLIVYLGLGGSFAPFYMWRGVCRVDPHGAHMTWGARLFIAPGIASLWPLLALRWLRGVSALPEERTAHRVMARCKNAPSSNS